MLAWMIYVALVAMPLGAAALMAEKAAKRRHRPTRWSWMTAIAVSLLLPIAVATVSVRLPASVRTATAPASVALSDTTSIPLVANVIDWSGAQPYASSMHVETILRNIWLAVSITLALVLGWSTAMFHRRKRGWTPGNLCGMPVLVSDDVGPAVVGLIRSRIVVPAWLLEESPEQQRYVMAHEQSHLEARDPLLVAVALVLLVSMPWSPLLWWKFHRLRCAIEVDCDSRVLRDGGEVGAYCETLIHVGQNQSGYVGAVTAMSESKSFLERRIRIMLSKPPKWARASALALLGVSLGMAAVAAQVTPPVDRQPVAEGLTLSPAALDAYDGFYRPYDQSLITVRHEGNGLTITPIGQFAAQGTLPVTAISDTEFVVPNLDARIEFVKGSDRRAASLIVYMHGALVMTASRVDAATAERIRRSLAARVKEQKPFPDSENALRLILSNRDDGAGLSPEMAQILARQHGYLEDYFAKLGPVESYRFEGVTDYGWDSYLVKHRNGTQQVLFQMDAQGLIVNEVVRRR